MADDNTQSVLFHGASLIDGIGGPAIADAALLVVGAVIKQLGRRGEVKAGPGTAVVNLAGKTIMPGLINCHIHMVLEPVGEGMGLLLKESLVKTTLRAAANIGKQLRGGVTYLRDVGGYNFIDLEIKKCRQEGFITGPDLLVSGQVITMTGGTFHVGGRECDGEAEVRKGVREQLKRGVDLIKIMATGGVLTPGVEPGAPQLTLEEIRAAVEEAHKAGRKTAAHAQGNTGLKNAVRAGIDSIEHGMYLDDEAVELMLKNGTYLVPTISAPYYIIKFGVENGVPAFAVEKTKRGNEAHMRSFEKAKAAGVKIAMGTDSGTPFNLHDKSGFELKLMVDWGMTPMEAIMASTKTAAELLGVGERYGTLAPGKTADFLVLKENPLANIETLVDIEKVYKNGKPVD